MKLKVLFEGYCEACGGWDKEQMGSGHKLGCPVGEPGTPIGSLATLKPEMEGGVIEGKFDINDIEHIYSEIKGYGGVIIEYSRPGPDKVFVRIMFDTKETAEGFNDLVNDPHVIGSDIFDIIMPPASLREITRRSPGARTQSTVDNMVARYKNGIIDHEFVREYDLS